MTAEEKLLICFGIVLIGGGFVVGAVKFLAYWRIAFGG